MRKKISSGNVVPKQENNDEGAQLKPELVECSECGIAVDLTKAAKIGPGAWQCPNPDCNAVVARPNKVAMLADGESDEIYEQVTPKHQETSQKVNGELLGSGLQDMVRVTWGPEKIQVRRFNPIDIGPFEYTTAVREGETLPQALARAEKAVTQMGESIRLKRVASFAKFLSDNFGTE